MIIMSKPRLVRTGPGSAVAMLKSNAGPPLEVRSIPNTSQMTPNSNGATPGSASRTTFLARGTLRIEVGSFCMKTIIAPFVAERHCSVGFCQKAIFAAKDRYSLRRVVQAIKPACHLSSAT